MQDRVAAVTQAIDGTRGIPQVARSRRRRRGPSLGCPERARGEARKARQLTAGASFSPLSMLLS
jgi:hypothetical protein